MTQPGGTYLFSTWRTMTENPSARIAHEATAAFFPDNPPGFYLVPFSYADPDTVKADLENTGWRDVEHVDIPLRKTIPDLTEFARGLVYGNPMIDEIRQRGGVDAKAVVARISAQLALEFGANGNVMPLKTTTYICRRSD